jgi:hypothetical protein
MRGMRTAEDTTRTAWSEERLVGDHLSVAAEDIEQLSELDRWMELRDEQATVSLSSAYANLSPFNDDLLLLLHTEMGELR